MSEPAETLDGEVVEERDTQAHDFLPAAPAAATLAVTPQVQATELVERLSVIRSAQETAMIEGVDYGVVPGTNKPTLLKPGAEKLGVLFQLDVQLTNEKVWGPDEHLTVIAHATVFHAPTGTRLGYGEGVCTTRERKYAKRKQERICPNCEKPAVIKGKEEFGGGWLCWVKKDGCGTKFDDGDQTIEGQDIGEIDNPDLPDLWNTVTKMAEKRARVDAVLAVTGASALFTQDMEDSQQPSGKDAPARTTTRRSGTPSDAQLRYLDNLGKQHRPTVAQLRAIVPTIPAVLEEGWMRNLSSADVSKLIERLKAGDLPEIPPSPTPDDEPGDGEFVHSPTDDRDMPWTSPEEPGA